MIRMCKICNTGPLSFESLITHLLLSVSIYLDICMEIIFKKESTSVKMAARIFIPRIYLGAS